MLIVIDRLRPDNSTLLLVRIFRRFENEVDRYALECLGRHAWSGGAVKDGSVQGNAISRIELQIKKLLNAVIPHDADSAVDASEPIDHSPGNHDGIVEDVALSQSEHAADRQKPVGVDAHPAC